MGTTTTTPLLILLLLAAIFTSSVLGSLSPSLDDDVLGLIVFKSDLQDPDGRLSSWNQDDDTPCNWFGVKCNPRSNRVTELSLSGLSLSGRIGRGLLQLQFLRKLTLSGNNLTGSFSPELSRLQNITAVDLSGNSLSGAIPSEFFAQCGSLRAISLAGNGFSGKIPDTLSSCASLVSVNFSSNQFSGSLPAGIWGLTGLRSVDFSDNLLEGEVPLGIERLNNLRGVNLSKNRFSGKIPDGIGRLFLLRTVDFSRNSFSGSLPRTMRNLGMCVHLSVGGNLLTGEIPSWVGEMKRLESLDLSMNNFSAFNSSPKFEYLDLSNNVFSGEIGSNIGYQSKLMFLDLSKNSLAGPIPGAIGELKQLEVLDLSDNKFNGSIPMEIGAASSLKELKLDSNFLSGQIPNSIGDCSSLTTLVASGNILSGPIPAAMAKLTNLQYVDLSINSLSGSLPKQLANLPNIATFNISLNHLQGELPSGGFFNTISPSSVSGNPSLCGAVVNRTCHRVLPKPIVLNPDSTAESSTDGSLPRKLGHKRIILSVSSLIAIGAAALIVVGVIAITVLNLRVQATTSRSAAALTFSAGDDGFSSSPTTDANSGKLVMFSGDPDFSAGTHALLNKDCELGRGGFGAVYRTVLGDGQPVAIKKLTVSSLVKSRDDFEREVKKLGKIRHRNLVQLEGYYWTPSLQLLIYEFLSGGSLYKHLHEGSGGHMLSWNERFNLILGTAKGLAHLHQCNIIHYNIKSSNILIDGSGEPKVGDFGLARLLPMLDRYVLSSKIQSALGYMAPEFACRTVKITEKCDVYGFGVLVLEIITGRKPVEYMEDDVVMLCDTVRAALEEGKTEECIDESLQGAFPTDEAIPVVKLGLICTSQVPSNRPDMSEVVNILEMIRCPSEGQE
ncbi:Probable LRR receptor-like serine/threonine-protein kinase IRK [Linum perenne]